MSKMDGKHTFDTETGKFRVYRHKNPNIFRKLNEYGSHEGGNISILLKILPFNCNIYDIGAHIGIFSVALARNLGPDTRVWAFEGEIENFRDLDFNICLNDLSDRVFPRNAVVYGKAGVKFVSYGGQRNFARTKFQPTSDESGLVSISVDEVRKELPAPDFIKIDVEGMDVDVLRGSLKTISQDRPIILFETHAADKDLTEIIEELRKINYDCFVNSGEIEGSNPLWRLGCANLFDAYKCFQDVFVIPKERLPSIKIESSLSVAWSKKREILLRALKRNLRRL